MNKKIEKVFCEVFTVNSLDKETSKDGQAKIYKAVNDDGDIRSFDTYNEALDFIKDIEPEEFEKSVFSIEKHYGIFEVE